MSRPPISETAQAEFPPRDDVIFEAMSENAAEMVTSSGLVVLRGFETQQATADIRATMQHWLLAHAPIRLGRHVVRSLIPDGVRLPHALEPAPFELSMKRAALLPPVTANTIARIERLQATLFGYQPVIDMYGSPPPELDTIRFNILRSGKDFIPHADTYAYGLAFILQTSPTKWKLSPTSGTEGPAKFAEPFSVTSDAGDLVVLAEKDSGDITNSLTHDCENLTTETRYSLGVFALNGRE